MVQADPGRVEGVAGRRDGAQTEELLADVFDLEARIVPDPVTGTPMVVPVRRLR